MKRNVVNHFTMNAGVNKLHDKYLIELSKTLILELSPDLSITTKIKQVETLLAEKSLSMRSKNKMTIFFLISSELTSEVDAIDECIENVCIKYRLSNAILISLTQVETKYKVSNEGTLDYRLKKQKIKHSLTDDLRAFLENLYAGQINTDLNEERNLFSIDKPKRKLKNLIPYEKPILKEELSQDQNLQKPGEPIEIKIGYKQQKTILKRDYWLYNNFEWWFPPVDRQQVFEDERATFTLYHVLRRSRGIKRRHR